MIGLSLAIAIWGFASFVFTVAAIGAVKRMYRRAIETPPPSSWPAIAILRPCEGLDCRLEENLLSSVTAPYLGKREVWLLVPSERDPAYPILERVKAEAARRAPEVRVELVVTAIETGANRKVAQLARATARTTAEILVSADSDICFTERTLAALVGSLMADPRSGASSGSPVEVACETVGDRISAAVLSSTPHAFLCLKALAERSGGAHVLCGALVAVKRAVLDEVGGMASLEPFLGEDFELARRLHERGYLIPTSPEPARVSDRGRTALAAIRRYARWCTVTRQQRPELYGTYPLLLGCTPLVLFGAALALASGAPLGWLAASVVAVALAVRWRLATLLRRLNGIDGGPLAALFALLAGESVIVIASLLALGRPEIEWRGRRYRIERGGSMSPLAGL
ncbi:MAG TPA: glycosyltransferase [Polyangia bacterium]